MGLFIIDHQKKLKLSRGSGTSATRGQPKSSRWLPSDSIPQLYNHYCLHNLELQEHSLKGFSLPRTAIIEQRSQYGGHYWHKHLAHRRPTSAFQCYEARARQEAQKISLTFFLNPKTCRCSFRLKKKIDFTFHVFKTPKNTFTPTPKAEASRSTSPNHGYRTRAHPTEANRARERVRSSCCQPGNSRCG